MNKCKGRAYLFSLLILVVLSCGGLSGGPKTALSKYYEALKAGKYSEAYALVSASDKQVKNYEAYLSELGLNSPLGNTLYKQTSYKILQVEKNGQNADAEVELTIPDMGVIIKDIMGAAMLSASGGQDSTAVEKLLAEKYGSGQLPLTTEKIKVQLVQESDGWKVYFNWEQKEKIAQLLSEAEALDKAGKPQEALDKIKQALALDSSNVVVQEAAEKTGKAVERFEQQQAYLEKVQLYDFKAQYYRVTSSQKKPGVEFKIKNQGDRTLTKVVVTVYFKDASGALICEETYKPVLVSKYNLGSKPLKPNYVWQLDRGQFFNARSVPTEWDPGAAEARITELEFEEN